MCFQRECAPLYLEENTTIGLLNSEQLGVFLLAVTPSPKHGKGCCLTFRVWDSASILGFTPKEIQVQDGEGSFVQDGKFRFGSISKNTLSVLFGKKFVRGHLMISWLD